MPKILGGQPPGKIGNADIINHLLLVSGFLFLFYFPVGAQGGAQNINRTNICSDILTATKFLLLL